MKHKRYYYGIIGVSAVGLIVVLSFINLWYRSRQDAGTIIAHDIVLLRDIFHKIHQDCGIIDFDAQKNPINFLNVEKFSGSEVGPMNLMYPDRWKGPYLQDNPTIYHIAYQVVSTKNGYFIMPGDGVCLPNKKVIGTDIIVDKKTDIEAMIQDNTLLRYQDQPLAARLELGAAAQIQFFFDVD